jgi:hypothetical protein
MPHVLRRGDQLRQHQGAGTEEALELEHAAPGRPEEQIVVEEAGVDGLIEKERVALHVAIHKDDRNAHGIEHAGPVIDVVHRDQRLAAHIAVYGEGV